MPCSWVQDREQKPWGVVPPAGKAGLANPHTGKGKREKSKKRKKEKKKKKKKITTKKNKKKKNKKKTKK